MMGDGIEGTGDGELSKSSSKSSCSSSKSSSNSWQSSKVPIRSDKSHTKLVSKSSARLSVRASSRVFSRASLFKLSSKTSSSQNFKSQSRISSETEGDEHSSSTNCKLEVEDDDSVEGPKETLSIISDSEISERLALDETNEDDVDDEDDEDDEECSLVAIQSEDNVEEKVLSTTASKEFAFDHLNEVLERLEIASQEPWPKDVKLFQPYEVEQILLPDNANCLAVQAFLKMCNLDFQVEPRANAEAMSPSGKVPFIKAGAFVVSELEPIVQFVNNKGITLTEKLEPEMKSDMRAYMSLVHNVLEVAELYICWCDKETYSEVTSVRHGSIYPWPLNHIQNRSKRSAIIKKLKVLDWYQKTMSEVFQEVENCCQALTDRLEGKDYFFGDKPTELDALVFGHLFTILTTPLPNSHIANTVRNFPVLIQLVQRIEKDYFKRETKH